MLKKIERRRVGSKWFQMWGVRRWRCKKIIFQCFFLIKVFNADEILVNIFLTNVF
jgi:hypothetical protein